MNTKIASLDVFLRDVSNNGDPSYVLLIYAITDQLLLSRSIQTTNSALSVYYAWLANTWHNAGAQKVNEEQNQCGICLQ